jgi:hypothetical protein
MVSGQIKLSTARIAMLLSMSAAKLPGELAHRRDVRPLAGQN